MVSGGHLQLVCDLCRCITCLRWSDLERDSLTNERTERMWMHGTNRQVNHGVSVSKPAVHDDDDDACYAYLTGRRYHPQNLLSSSNHHLRACSSKPLPSSPLHRGTMAVDWKNVEEQSNLRIGVRGHLFTR